MSSTILIVDDSALVRSQLRTALEAKGMRVLEAENGSQGIWRARENQADLVLADIHMPIMDGLRMIAELRKLPAYLTTPILVLTSDAASTRVEEGKKAGANGWLLKPVQPDLLWKAIERVLNAKPRTPSSAEASVPFGSGTK